MANEQKKWRPDMLDTKFMGGPDSPWKKDKNMTGFSPNNHSYFRTDEMKTPSGIPYSYGAVQHDYHRNKPPRNMELELPDLYMGGRGFTQDELADFLSMYENGNPFYKNMQKVDYGETNYAPYQDTPEYNAWLQQFRDYAHGKYGITDDDENDYYSRGDSYGNPLSKDYRGVDDYMDSMGTRAARYISDMRGLKSVPELFGRNFKK